MEQIVPGRRNIGVALASFVHPSDELYCEEAFHPLGGAI